VYFDLGFSLGYGSAYCFLGKLKSRMLRGSLSTSESVLSATTIFSNFGSSIVTVKLSK
jgi:hypothetical protein